MTSNEIGDLAVNLAQGAVTLREIAGRPRLPEELAPMAIAVRAMVSKEPGRTHFSQRRDGHAGFLEE